MKNKFSTAWKGSKQPRKQRKYAAMAPLHIKKKLVNANLSKELRKKYGKRSVAARKGDSVKIMRGKFKGKTGKIIKVDLKKSKMQIENIQVKKMDGSKVNVWIQPSNVMLTELNTDDRKRNLGKKENNEMKESKNAKTENKVEKKK